MVHVGMSMCIGVYIRVRVQVCTRVHVCACVSKYAKPVLQALVLALMQEAGFYVCVCLGVCARACVRACVFSVPISRSLSWLWSSR